jgi:flagellin
MRINHNISAMNTYRQMSANNANQAKNMERLSSGLRINRGADDAAGLSISEKMRAQIRGLDQASKNAQDGISLIQTADGALNETHSILQRMRELGVQASSETNTAEDWKAIQNEIDTLVDAIDNIGDTTSFNGQKLLDGKLKTATVYAPDGVTVATPGTGVEVSIGADGKALEINIGDMRTTELGLGGLESDGTTATLALADFRTSKASDTTPNNTLSTPVAGGGTLTERDVATKLISAVDTAIKSVSSQRSQLGAIQNRLDYTISNLESQSENIQTAESRIRDVDMAKEMLQSSKNSILAQASQAMLAQANQQPQAVLQLLRG